MVDSGIILLKYWLEVSPEEQTRRLEGAHRRSARKIWKLSPMDLKSYSRWYDYSRARDDMFAATDTGFAPWYVARSDDKRRARLNIISHILSRIPYESCRARRSSCRSGRSPTVMSSRTILTGISRKHSDATARHHRINALRATRARP